VSDHTPPIHVLHDEEALIHELRTILTVAHGFSALVDRHLHNPAMSRERVIATNMQTRAQIARLEATLARHFGQASHDHKHLL